MARPLPQGPPGPVPLDNAIVRLEPLAESHREGLRVIAGDPRIWPFMPIDGGQADEFDRLIDEALSAAAQGRERPFAVRRATDGRLVGSSRYLNIAPGDGGLEIGWTWYTADVWGGTVNPAVKRLMLGHAFDVWGAVRVGLRCDTRNQRSHDAILRLGAVKEGVLRRNKRVQNGFIRDSAVFSILVEEWPTVRDGLDARLNGR